MRAFEKAGVDPSYYTTRGFGLDEILPWDVIDCGVTKKFLLRERNFCSEGIAGFPDLCYNETNQKGGR